MNLDALKQQAVDQGVTVASLLGLSVTSDGVALHDAAVEMPPNVPVVKAINGKPKVKAVNKGAKRMDTQAVNGSKQVNSGVSGTPTMQELLAQIEQLKAHNAALAAKQAQGGAIRLKVSEKGALSVYGLNARFPVTLYRGQWEKLLSIAPQIKSFIAENAKYLSVKE